MIAIQGSSIYLLLFYIDIDIDIYRLTSLKFIIHLKSKSQVDILKAVHNYYFRF